MTANDVKSAVNVASTTTLNKKKTGGKEKDEMTKIVLRRLPPGMSKSDLISQLQPLKPEPRAFWFCPADMELRPHAFSRAYLVFQEEKDAIQFSDRFNGYVLVDKLGNESMAIVELALNQSVPKSLLSGKTLTAMDCDTRCGTLKNEAQYLKFFDQYNQILHSSNKRVNDFDGLVRQLEEKQRRQEEGQIQETPLTDYINKLSQEKGRKKQQKLVESNDQTPDQQKEKTRAPAPRVRGNKVVLDRKLEEKKHRHEEGQVQETPLTDSINKISQEKRRKKQQKSDELNDQTLDQQKEKTLALTSHVIGNKVGLVRKLEEKKHCQKEGQIQEETSLTDSIIKPSHEKERKKQQKLVELNNQTPDQGEEKARAPASRVRGNKNRPEIEIYRPHAGRLLPKTSTSKQPKITVAEKIMKRNQQNEKQN